MNRKIYLTYSHGSWYAREQYPEYDDEGRQRIRERWRSLGVKGRNRRAAAEKALESFKRQRARLPADPVLRDMNVAQYLAQYLRSAALSVRPKTMESYRHWLRTFEEIYAAVPLRSVTPMHIETWRAGIARRTSAATANIALRTLRAAFSRAQRAGLIHSSPCAPIAAVDVPHGEFPPFWTRPQFADFIGGVEDQRHRIAFSLAFYAGLRRGEVIALRWEDVHEEHLVVASRGDHRTKSGRSRKVPLFSSLRTELERTEQRSAYVVRPHRKSRSTAEPNSLSAAFRRHVMATELPQITFHGLRHSFATMMAIEGIPIAVLRQLLGHADISTTMLYVHVQDDLALGAIRNVDM